MAKARIGDVEINIISSEVTNHAAESTDHAVERGEDITDHTKTVAPIVEITGAVMGDGAAAKLQKLKKYQKDGELLRFTSRTIYNNMFIESLSTDHHAGIRDGYEFEITLKQVKVVSAKEFKITAVNPTTKKADPKVNTKVKPMTNNGRQQVQAS